MRWSDAKCVYCGCPITFAQLHTFGGVCDDAKCKNMQLNALYETKRLANEERLESRRQAAIEAYKGTVVANTTNALGQAVVLTNRQVYVVPAMLRALTDLPENRRTAFVAHLTSMVDSSFGENDDIESETVDSDPLELDRWNSNPLPILSAACGVCQGECCRNGGMHAFVSTKLIDGMRLSHPGISPQPLIDLYLSYLPQRSFDGSCVFHQATGCALPRLMRAEVCNQFECEDLHFIRTESNASPAVLVSLEGMVPVRIIEFDQVANKGVQS